MAEVVPAPPEQNSSGQENQTGWWGWWVSLGISFQFTRGITGLGGQECQEWAHSPSCGRASKRGVGRYSPASLPGSPQEQGGGDGKVLMWWVRHQRSLPLTCPQGHRGSHPFTWENRIVHPRITVLSPPQQNLLGDTWLG